MDTEDEDPYFTLLKDPRWVRTCQECMTQQICPQPGAEMTDAYRERKCKRCKSPALDYGSFKENPKG